MTSPTVTHLSLSCRHHTPRAGPEQVREAGTVSFQRSRPCAPLSPAQERQRGAPVAQRVQPRVSVVQARAQVPPGPRLRLGSEGALRLQTLNAGGVYSASEKGSEGKGCGQGGPHGWMRKRLSGQAPPRSQGRLAHLLAPRLIPRFCQQSTRTWGTGVPSPVVHSGART